MWLWTDEADLLLSRQARHSQVLLSRRAVTVATTPISLLVPHTGTHARRHAAYLSMHMCVP